MKSKSNFGRIILTESNPFRNAKANAQQRKNNNVKRSMRKNVPQSTNR